MRHTLSSFIQKASACLVRACLALGLGAVLAQPVSPGPARKAGQPLDRGPELPSASLEEVRRFDGALVSLNFQNVDVRALLQLLADHSGVNIVASDSITGSMAIRVRNLPWDQVLDTIVQMRGLAVRREGDVIWVASRAELAARERQEHDGAQALLATEPVRMQSFRLNYARADEVARQLMAGPGAARLLSSRGSVMAEVRTNQLFVTDVGSRITLVEGLLRQLDIPVRQVMIEARIVEAADSFGKSLGVRLGGRPLALPPAGGSRPGLQAGGGYLAPRVPASGDPVSGRDYGIAGTDFVNLPAAAINGLAAAGFAVSLFNASVSRVLNLELSALEADGKGQVVASPRIVTADQVKAIIEQGTELPYQQSTSSGATAVAFRKANLKLEVTPQITPEGSIILNVDVNKDSVGRSTPNGFAIDTKHVQTQVLVDNGGTVMIGGIFETQEREEETRVPLLGSLPGLGILFRTRTKSLSKTELLVFITPHLLQELRPSP